MLSDRKNSFKNWSTIPEDFEGDCCFNDREVECSLKKGKLFHNPNGPAYKKLYDNYTQWRLNNMRHRLNGPAIYGNDDDDEYWIFDIKYTTERYWSHPLVIQYKLHEILKQE